MPKIPFSEKELNVVGSYTLPGVYGMPAVTRPRYDYPITPKENMELMMSGKLPVWIPNQWRDNNIICPYVVPDFYARSFGGTDWFGIEWQYEPLSQAAMVKPGTRRLSDITRWKEEIVFPDIQAIDWEKDVRDNFSMLPNDRFTYFVIQNGIFERIADLTSFEDTFLYLLTEQEALCEFLDALVDWHIEFMKVAKKYYHADMILWHDDMGSQKAPFFSPDLFRYARQFAEADEIIIAAPYWDLLFPAVLRTYFEMVTVTGVTFYYTPEGIPKGLCKASRILYVMTAGGPVGDYNFGFDYVKALAHTFYGIPETICVKAENLDIVGADPEKILQETMDTVTLG